MLFTCSKRVQSRLALYHGVRALYINFTNNAEETFCNALSVLQVLFFLSYLSLKLVQIISAFLSPLLSGTLELALIGDVDSEQKRGMVQDGEEVALVQSGRQPIWRSEYSHHIQVRKVRS